MAIDLTNPVFHDDEKARELFEAWRWPNGPVCPHCGEWKELHRLEGKSYTAGALYCRSCRKKFSVTVGTVMERSHIPISQVDAGLPADDGQQEGYERPSSCSACWASPTRARGSWRCAFARP